MLLSDGSILVQRNTYPYKMETSKNGNLNELTQGLVEDNTINHPALDGVTIDRHFYCPKGL